MNPNTLYTEALIEEAIDFWVEVLAEMEPEPDREAIKARFLELRETQPELFEQEYGPAETRKQERLWVNQNVD